MPQDVAIAPLSHFGAVDWVSKKMLAYKFRSSTQLAFALDIILNKRLHCSDWRELNDPMEGIFRYSYGSEDERALYEKCADILSGQKKRLLVCSLSKRFNSPLLWAHYAEGFRGLVIEVELPDNSPSIRSVVYGDALPLKVFFDGNSPPTAEEILSYKYRVWDKEDEVRILHTDEWYRPTPVKRVITGHRMDDASFQALKIICERKHITLSQAGIGSHGIEAV